MDPELQDLIPLFVSEGKRRLEKLCELASQVSEADAAAKARRELHTLKGSSRMLRLSSISELCHRAENLLQEPVADSQVRFTEHLDRLSELLEGLGREAEGRAEGEITAPEPITSLPGAAVVEGSEHRVPAAVADELTANAAATRLLAVAGLNASERLNELALMAEESLREPQAAERTLALLASNLRQASHDLEANQRRLVRRAEDQLNRLLDIQLQPLRPFLLNLARHTRELARTLGKEVEVEVHGGEARLDQRISAELRAAFLHLVRNAVDHGIEPPARRVELGKPRAGTVRIEATSLGDRVEITVADDGTGIDADQVLKTAQEAGLAVPEGVTLSQPEIYQLLFATGFSTLHQVSEVSGRGMGLDAVGTMVRNLGGEVWLESEVGSGSSIFIEVPTARRGELVLVLRVGRDRVALPKVAVRGISRADREALIASEGGLLAEIDGELQRVVPLGHLLGGEEIPPQLVLISLQVAGMHRVIAVDEVEEEKEVLLHPFARAVATPSFFTGCALLPSGEPIAVLAPRAMLNQIPGSPAPRPPAAPPRALRVLLVEDSLVTREMERRMLQEEGFAVTAASDAAEALERLGEQSFDCMVTDIEMPGMDGLELTRKVRASDRLAQLPIIVVSTRERPGDRTAGMEAGADAYLSKKVLESRELASAIRRLGSGG